MKLNDEQKFVFLKTAEELNELSAELLKAVNKNNKRNLKRIEGEISDVEQRVFALKNTILELKKNNNCDKV